MRAVKGKETRLEKDFRKHLSTLGFRYRKNVATMPGKPDVVFSKKKIVIFVDSCFWHGCKKHCRIPATQRKYWLQKIKGNILRDKKITTYYQKEGWKIFRFWEHDFKLNGSKIFSLTEKLLIH